MKENKENFTREKKNTKKKHRNKKRIHRRHIESLENMRHAGLIKVKRDRGKQRIYLRSLCILLGIFKKIYF